MQAKIDNRNQFVDIMRGIAMLLVVLGHTMTGCTVDSQKSFLFNIIWSLQMPLFILISGYVTKYSRPISDGKELWKYVKRRTVAYMLPWAVWSFLVRGIIFGENSFLNVKHLLWNMDSGYWFLATIWTISMIFGVASFGAERVSKENLLKKQTVLLGCYVVGMVLLVGIGAILGLSFFAIKLTLYYMPFYYAGFLYGQFDDRMKESDTGKKMIDSIVAICFVMWMFIILRFPLYEMSDGGAAIILRAATSLAGCIAVCGLCKGIFSSKIGGGYNHFIWRALSCLRALSLFSPRSSFRTNPNGSAAKHTHQRGFSSQTARQNTFLQGMVTWVSTSLTRAQITELIFTRSGRMEKSSQEKLLDSQLARAISLFQVLYPLRKVIESLSTVPSQSYGSRQRWGANSNLSTGGALC